MPDVLGTINGSFASEFEAFQRKLAAEFLMWQRGIVDEYRREDQFVTHNFDFYWKKDALAPFGHSFGVQPGINHYEASKATTLLGCDIYHATQDDLTGSEIAYDGDSIRSLRNAQYFVLETEAQAFRYWTPYPGQLMQQALSHLASGALGVEYWHWHSIHNSYETYWKGLLSHDMEENAVYQEACEVGKLFNEIYPSKVEELLKANDPTVLQAREILTLNDDDFAELKRHYPKGWAVNSHTIMGASDLHRYIGDCGVANITRFIGVITFKTAGNCFVNPIRLPIGDTTIERQSHSVLVVNEWIVDPALNANTMNFDDYIKLLWKENDKLRIDFILSMFVSWDDSIHALNTRQCELFKNHDFGCSEQKFLAAATTAGDGQAHLKECLQMLQGVSHDYVKAHQAMNDLFSGMFD